MIGTRPTIALLLDHFLGDYQTIVRDAVEITAKEQGADFLCFIGRPVDSPHQYEQVQNEIFSIVTSQSVSGVIVLGATLSLYAGKERIADFCRGFAPLPICNIGLEIDGVPSVVVDNSHISVAVSHLVNEHGCRSIAYIGGPRANEEAVSRREGFIAALDALGVPFDAELERYGTFSQPSGRRAAMELLDSGKTFDGMVAANDNMAIGALSVFRKRGIDVPGTVRVAGFDDSPAARLHTPKITSMRQPLEEMGRCAADMVLKQIRGESVRSVVKVVPRLIRRHSCGCAAGRREVFLTQGGGPVKEGDLPSALHAHRESFERLLLTNVQIPEQTFSRWAKRLVDALFSEADGKRGTFVSVLEDILSTAELRLWLIDELQNAVTVLREQFFRFECRSGVDFESVWDEARVLLSDAATCGRMKDQVAADLASALFLGRAEADLPSTPSKEALASAIAGEFETIGLESGLVSLFPKEDSSVLECLVAVRNGMLLPEAGTQYDSELILPPFFSQPDRRMSFVVVPLSSGGDRLGVMVMELGLAELYYEILRDHMSSHLKSITTFQVQVEALQAEADKRREELELQHRQKLESLGVLAGGIAHDFNNMLSAMAGNLDVALFDLEEDLLRPEPILECKSVVKHASGLCKQLLAYSGKGKFVLKRLNLNTILEDLEELLIVSISKSVRLSFDLKEPLPDIEGDVAQLTQCFVNLAINASESISNDWGKVTISTATRNCDEAYLEDVIDGSRLSPGEYVVVSVADTGIGIEKGILPRIFDPFFTTKAEGRGLGLAAVLGIVRGHNGAIKVHSNGGLGTRIELLFPHLPMLSVVPKASSAEPPPVWQGTVLMVDDEPTVLRAGERLLQRMGFSVITAANGDAGIDIFKERHEAITCVILDITMPGKGGMETLKEMRSVSDEVPIILSSGYSEEQAIRTLDKGAPDSFLAKPYDYERLSELLRETMLWET